MVGRNGHLRWPEALRIVQEFWRHLPPSYRFNQKLGGFEETFADWDCSVEGFEGVRSQDVLPLLLEYFHFQLFIPFGNVIDPFIDRAFGPHFDVTAEWDRNFLDRVHQRDELEMAAGRLTPTHLLAVMGTGTAEINIAPSIVRRLLRSPARLTEEEVPPASHYDWAAWDHSRQDQLEIICGRLAELESGHLLRARTAWAQRLQGEVEHLTALALHWKQELQACNDRSKILEQDLTQRTAWALDLENQLAVRTHWAMSLAEDVRLHAVALVSLRTELETRTAWAQGLDAELVLHSQSIARLEAELKQQRALTQHLETTLRNPFRYAARLVKAVGRRLSY